MNKANQQRELVVIGAGPGGYAAAFHAADHGVNVTLIDREENPGGVCLYRGCIPSKALLHVAKIIKEARQAADWGIHFDQPDIDVERLREWKNEVVGRLTRGLGGLCKKRKIEYLRGSAEFIGKNKLSVRPLDGEPQEIGYAKAIIATGSRTVELPHIPMDSDKVIDSDMSLEIKDIPESMLVIGSGYIGLEQGNIYARLGTRVTVVEMTSQLLPGIDEDLVAILAEHLEGCFEEILLNSKVTGIEPSDEGVKVQFEGEAAELNGRTFTKVLVAVGRQPNTQELGLDNTGVECDEKGFIKVDSRRKTTDGAIFAVGDVTGNPQLAHKATHEGLVAAKVVAGREAAFEPHAIPFVEYSEIEIAGCGLSEQEAREAGVEIKVTRFPWSASGRALTMGESKGMTKLVFAADTGRLLGVGIVGSDAGKLIAEGVLAIEMAAVARDLAHTMHPHPTLSETIMEAAEEFTQKSVNL